MRKTEVPIDVIVPVFNGREETLQCLESLRGSLAENRLPAEIIVIYDCGPDDSLREELLSLASRQQITLMINDSNAGFVRSVNRGMSRHPERDVVLLNSDTRVANDWLDRLAAAAASDDDIATVTPFSNNAEICSWPRNCEPNPLPPGEDTRRVDRAFRALGPHRVEIPTAVGFCMYIRRDSLRKLGLFNAELFGDGYGEENDFCMRASRAGYRHLLAADTFVYHTGAVSFAESKQSRVKRALEILDRLYPDYNALVARHIDEDPARKWRFAAELSLMRQSGKPLILHISHGIGGGTDKHVVQLCEAMSEQASHAMLVPQKQAMRLVFPNVISGGLFDFPDTARSELIQLLLTLGLSRVHVHHVSGWENTILSLVRQLAVPWELTLHDYYYIHPNPALADSRGRFCEDPDERDARCAAAIPYPPGFDAASWRARWGEFMAGAWRIIAPGHAAAEIYRGYYPHLDIRQAFHPDWHRGVPYPPVVARSRSPGEPLRVVVLGALSLIKGATVLEDTAMLAARRGLAMDFTLVGYAYRALNSVVTTTGAYSDEQLPELVARYKPHLIWFPCSWPETYSYTLSYALEAGIPVLCPDIGAFPERLRNRPKSWLASWKNTPAQWLETMEEVGASFADEPETLEWPEQPQSEFCYAREYIDEQWAPAARPAMVEWGFLMSRWLPALPRPHTIHRSLLRLVCWLNFHPLFGRLATVVPLGMRRAIKRKLSRKPLHE